nr:hypothetical protein [Tanacetum cinerariifolium]
MSPLTHKKFHWGIGFLTGRKSFTNLEMGLRIKRTNRKCKIPIKLYPCRVEEKLIMKELEGEWIMKKGMRITLKDHIIFKFPGYTSSKEEEDKEEKIEALEMGSNSEPPGYAAIDDDAGILTNEVVRCGILTRSSEKRKEVEETSKQGGSWKDNKKEKVGKGFAAIAPLRNENVGSYPKCSKCSTYHPEGGPCRLCYNCQKAGHFPEIIKHRLGSWRQLALSGWKLTKGLVMNVGAPFIFTILLYKNKAKIVCHEKVVRIPLESGEILHVQGECTLGGTRTLMSMKEEEPELSDIPILLMYGRR